MYSKPDSQKPNLTDLVSSADSRKSTSLPHRAVLPSTAEIVSPPSPTIESVITAPRRTRNTPKRTHQVMTRFNQKEYTLFLRRLERSGLPQGDYLRKMALTGQITVVDQSELLISVLDMLTDIRTDLGKQNGMLKMILRPNEGQRQLSSAEWETLIKYLRQNEASVRTIIDIKEILNGNR